MPVPADEFHLPFRRIRASFDAAASTFDSAAHVHAEIRQRLLERLDVVRLDPGVVVDLGSATGHGSRALKDRYPKSQVVALDLSTRMLATARRQQRWLRRFHCVAGDASRLPLREASTDLIFSNLMLQWCDDPDAVFREARRILRPNGLLTFASLGPDSLRELREAWAQIDAHIHVHRFIDMHDLGDALVRTGFAEPVMDTERLTVTYRGLDALLTELRQTGSTTVAIGRRQGLVTPADRARFDQAYGRLLRDGVLPMTLEVVYGHAWSAAQKPQDPARGETRIPITSIGRR